MAKSDPSAPVNFEDAMTQLADLVQKMESGELSLEAALKSYQQGCALVAYCQKQLHTATQQIQVLEQETLVALEENQDGDEY